MKRNCLRTGINKKNMKIKLLLLLCIGQALWASAFQLDTLIVESTSMGKQISNLVILPENYAAQDQSLPVVYLLHGAGGNYTSWVSKAPHIKAYANTHNIIIVCPDGGVTSWYFDSPIDASMQYETYVSEELVEAVDKKYNTIANKKARAITGLSMGGHGAFYLAFRHTDIWGAAGSMSGGLDLRPYPNHWDISKRLGSQSENKKRWSENSVINMIYLLDGRNLKLIFDCGIDDFFYDDNQRMHEKLVERRIPHDYIERPGRHNWDYWNNAIAYQLLFFDNFFKEGIVIMD